MIIRDLIHTLLEQPGAWGDAPTTEAVFQLTGDGEHFFTVESIETWHDGGVVAHLTPFPPDADSAASEPEPDDAWTRHPWPYAPAHMRGWECFGVTDRDDPPTHRQLGHVTFRKGEAVTDEDPGTEDWPDAEVTDGVAWVKVEMYGGDNGAYLYVCGPDKDAVAACWHRTKDAHAALAAAAWGT